MSAAPTRFTTETQTREGHQLECHSRALRRLLRSSCLLPGAADGTAGRRSCSTPRTAATSSRCSSTTSSAGGPTSTCAGSTWASQEILDRLRFERVNPQADVWFGGPTTIFDRGVQRLAARAVPARPGPARVGPRGVGPGDLYYPVYRTPAVIAFNSRPVPRDEAPQDWDDVLEPALARQGADPRSDGERHDARHLGAHPRAEPPRDRRHRGRAWPGSAGSTARPRPTRSTRPSSTPSSRGSEGLVTLWDLPDILISRSKGMPFGYVFPRSGTVVIDDAIGLVRGSRHPDGGAGVHRLRRERRGPAARRARGLPAAGPARPAAATGSRPGWRRSSARWWWPTMDWDAARARQGAAWMGYWDRHVRGTRPGRRPMSRVPAARRPGQAVRRARSRWTSSRSRSSGARCWRCSGRAAAARPPRSGCSPGSRRRTRGASWWRARTSPRLDAGGAPLRHGVPALRALSPPRRAARTSPSASSRWASAAPSSTAGWPRRSRWWTWPASSGAGSASSPAASSSGWRWPGRWRPSRGCCCWTSRSPTSIPTLRERTRREIRELIRRVGITTVLVTHEQEEAFDLGDRVAVLRGGRLEQVGTPDELYGAPANAVRRRSSSAARARAGVVVRRPVASAGVRVAVDGVEWDLGRDVPAGAAAGPARDAGAARGAPARAGRRRARCRRRSPSAASSAPSASSPIATDGGRQLEVMAPPRSVAAGRPGRADAQPAGRRRDPPLSAGGRDDAAARGASCSPAAAPAACCSGSWSIRWCWCCSRASRGPGRLDPASTCGRSSRGRPSGRRSGAACGSRSRAWCWRPRSGSRWPSCSRATSSRARACSAAWWRCRRCCRRWSGVIAFLFLYGETGFVSLLVQQLLRLHEPPWRLQGAGAILLVHAYSMYVYFYLFIRAGLAVARRVAAARRRPAWAPAAGARCGAWCCRCSTRRSAARRCSPS